jgi:hypothetical protein
VFLKSRRPIYLALAIAAVLSIQLVPQSVFFGDDYLQIGVLEGTTRGLDAGPLDLYGFMDGSPESVQRSVRTGPIPWFVHPRFKVNFFRPVSSALVALDHTIFGLSPWGYRVQAILWYLLIVALYAAWLRHVMPADRGERSVGLHPAAVLALLIFAVSDSHWVNVAWTAGRWVLVTTAPALAGCVAYLRWRQERWRPGLLLSIVLFALGFLAGELTLAILAFPVAFEIVSPRANVRERVRGLAPLALVTGAYLTVYKLLGRGAYGGSEYPDPLSDPFGFLLELPGKMLAMLGEVFLWVPSEGWNVDSLRSYGMAAGAGALFLIALLLTPVFHGAESDVRILLGRLLLGTFGSMLPLAAGTPGGRNLIVPFIGAALITGIALHFWWTVLRSRGQVLRWFAAVLCLGVGFVHLALPPYRWVTGPIQLRQSSEWLAGLARSTPVVDEGVPDQRTVFLTVHFAVCWRGYFLRRLERLPMPERWWMLSAADAEHHYHRPSPERLVLETVGGEMMATRFECLVRSRDAPIRVGYEVDLDGMHVRVLGVGRYGPTRVEFTFDRSLDDPSIVLMAVLDGRLQRVEPPVVGETLRLPSSW